MLSYTVLAWVSASRAFVRAQQGRGFHHHQDKGSTVQGALGAWAWQLTAQSAVAAEPPPDAVIGLVAEVVLPTGN